VRRGNLPILPNEEITTPGKEQRRRTRNGTRWMKTVLSAFETLLVTFTRRSLPILVGIPRRVR
jgi:hypothetical protein